MMINIGTRVATVNIVFSTSRNAALIENKMLQYTTLSLTFHHCTLSELKTQVCTLSNVLACSSINCADQKQHPKPGLHYIPKYTLPYYIPEISFHIALGQNKGRRRNELSKRALFSDRYAKNFLGKTQLFEKNKSRSAETESLKPNMSLNTSQKSSLLVQ